MRWFKHMSDMLDDEWIQDCLIPEYGISGYGLWCGVLEIYAKHCGDTPGEFHQIPLNTFTRKLHASWTKVEKFLNFCATFGKLSFKKVEKFCDINIPKMKEYRDEWTSRKNKNSGVTRELLPNKNTELLPKGNNRKQKSPPTPQGELPLFDEFWTQYPKKVDKKTTQELWRKRRLDPRFDEIMAGLMVQKATEQWTRDGGKFIPNPSTFLNQERWNDVPTVEVPPQKLRIPVY